MPYNATVLADSISPHGDRLTTLDVEFPRMVLAEFNTHRMFSRNSASSRAIPVEKQILKVLEEPYVPVYWGANKRGMQAQEEIPEQEQPQAEKIWLNMRDLAVLGACALVGGIEKLKDGDLQMRMVELDVEYGEKLDSLALHTPVHKQLANRLLEPFMWHRVIVTATEWENFYALRANPEAQPEIRIAAEHMKAAQDASEPNDVAIDEWHLPLILDDEKDLPLSQKRFISIARCARVSYLTHHGVRDINQDIELYGKLAASGHLSPLEHIATPLTAEQKAQNEWSGNFRGWLQFRKGQRYESNRADMVRAQQKST